MGGTRDGKRRQGDGEQQREETRRGKSQLGSKDMRMEASENGGEGERVGGGWRWNLGGICEARWHLEAFCYSEDWEIRKHIYHILICFSDLSHGPPNMQKKYNIQCGSIFRCRESLSTGKKTSCVTLFVPLTVPLFHQVMANPWPGHGQAIAKLWPSHGKLWPRPRPGRWLGVTAVYETAKAKESHDQQHSMQEASPCKR